MKRMRQNLGIFLSTLLLVAVGAAGAAPEVIADPIPKMRLTPPPATGDRGSSHGGHQRGERRRPGRRGAGMQLALENGKGATVQFWAPDLHTREIRPEKGRLRVPKSRVDNYHAIVAERRTGHLQQAAIRYLYLRGKPSHESPSKLAAAQKTALEIEPAPIPREHSRYLANREWAFILRFQGKPLSGVPVILETSQGSRREAVSGVAGLIRFTLPDDFSGVKPGRRNNPPAELTLSAEYEAGATRYQTTLSAAYYADPGHWRSKGLGAAVAGLGLLAGGFIGSLGRRGKQGKKT